MNNVVELEHRPSGIERHSMLRLEDTQLADLLRHPADRHSD
ncbi:hypothetical protein ABH944_002607 [Caballeronia udeis]|jgi:hypothetical protein|uniref:Uncharacterized protein n=1 Tax=Caballeronia udeis TaxID=1232866 RepID=A0ABW8MEQ9_9BURK